jgi:predicted ATPase
MAVWQIQLLGGLRATHGNSVIAQFPSRPIAMLLARLALEPQRRHSREELIELLWPEVDLDVGRNRLRQVLSTLRRLLEPPDVPPYSVLNADRQTIGLTADAVSSDVREFEQFLRQGAIAQALACYRGDLLPGFLDEWVEDERTRLSALHARALARDSAAAEKAPTHEPPPLRHDAVPATAAGRGPQLRSFPSYVSVFFGRESDKRGVLDAVAQYRLVTLAGLGGFGKTRLAVESARAATGFDAVAFVPLSECSDADLIADCIRSALRMEASQEDSLAQLCAFLGEQDVLLVLDNFEQLVDDGTAVVLDLLERLPRLRCLVTSRRILDVAGEHVLVIDPLPVPQASMDAAEAAATPSLALFIDRARGARADFALTDDNRTALIQLCRALEGLPLAIEIAASRIRTYSPSEMCNALAERFALLTRQGQRGARYGRHASLQTTIEWSWHLLSGAQQQFFAAVSVFRGGWTAAAVESVCETGDARGQLEALVSASLVHAEANESGVTRFSMLDTLREFAQERLDTDAGELRARHRGYFLEVARQAATADSSIAEREFPNLKQALVTAVDDAEPAYALDLGVALRPYWEAHGTLPDELRLLQRAVVSCPNDEPTLHAGLNLLAQLTLTAGDTEQARGYAQRALLEAGDRPVRRAAALITLARVTWERDQHDDAVTGSLDEALALAAAAGVAEVEADALRVKATVALKHGSVYGDYRAANALFERAEALYRQIDQPRWSHRVLLSRSGCLVGLKRYDEARQMLATCEQYFARLNSVADLIAVANMTGYLESGQEHWQEAVAAGRRCVQLAWDRHAHLPLAMALWNLPQPLVMLGEIAVAARLMAFAAHFWERGIGPLSASDATTVEHVRKHAAKRLGVQRTATLWAQGAELSLADAVHLALTGRG